MTAEKFDKRQWSIRDRVIFRGKIYSVKAVNWSNGMITIYDEVGERFDVPFEAVKIYNDKG